MSITTLDQAVAGMRQPVPFMKLVGGTMVAGRPQSYWGIGGMPSGGGFDNSLNGVTLSSTSAVPTGALRHYDPAGGINSYMARFQVGCTQAGVVWLCDRLWHNGAVDVTSTSVQNITTPAFPSRCPASGTDDTPSANGFGVMLAVEVSNTVGAGAPTFTISYTNELGVAGRTATNAIATAASEVLGATHIMNLQAGDNGVRSVQSIQLSATWTSGNIAVVAFRMLASIEMGGAFVGNSVDVLTGGLPRLYNGVVPYMLLHPSVTTASVLVGSYMETQG